MKLRFLILIVTIVGAAYCLSGQNGWLSVNSTGGEPKEALHVANGGFLVEGKPLVFSASAIPDTSILGVTFHIGFDTSGLLYDSGGPDGPYQGNESEFFFLPERNFNGIRIITIEEMDLGPGDTLFITSSNGQELIVTDSIMGVLSNDLSVVVQFLFKSDGVGGGAGFKISWHMLLPDLVEDTDISINQGMLKWYPGNYALRSGMATESAWSNGNVGPFSTAFGVNSNAKGVGSFAAGVRSTVSEAEGGVALGYENVVNGKGSIAMGFECIADASEGSLALGAYNKARGTARCFAIGTLVDCEGIEAVGIGSHVDVFATRGLGIGSSILVDTSESIVIGRGVHPGLKLRNNIPWSLMIGMKSDIPTFFVGPASGSGTLGKVGIGTTTPTSILTVNGTIESTSGGIKFPDGTIQTSSSYSTSWNLYGNVGIGSGDFIGTVFDEPLRFKTNNVERIIIESAGNVGIGTTNPSSLLTVDGTIESTSGGVKFPDGSIQTTTATLLAWKFGGNSGAITTGGLGTNDGRALKLKTNGLERLRIESDGDIGIGTTSPDTEFEISGSGSRYLRITSTNNAEIGLDLVRSGTGNSDYRLANNGGIFEIQETTDINGSAPETLYGFTTGALRPHSTDLNLDLGLSSKRWGDLYLSNVVHENSDRRLKKNIKPISYGLSEILALNPVMYQKVNGGNGFELGLIAQEVDEILPEVVDVPNNPDEYYSMVYRELIPVLIKSVQELSTQNEIQNKKIAELEQKLLNQKEGH